MIHGYDHWKQTNPADLIDHGEPPEVWEECETCGGEGAIEIPDPVSKWSIDPPGSHYLTCEVCCGAGGFIVEAKGDR